MEKRSAAIATVVLFVLVVVLFFGILTVMDFIYLCFKYSSERRTLRIKIALLLVEVIGAMLYFYGDNITFIFDQYGEVLGCDQKCIENNRIAAIITLGIALIFYHLFPPCLQKVASIAALPKSTGWYSASDMITTILKVDTLFTVVAIMAQTTDFCSKTDLTISIAFLFVSVAVGIALMFIYCTFSFNLLADHKEWRWIVPLAFIILVIAFPMYVLADNQQPLDCAFGCDSFAFNQTQNIGCKSVGNSALRLGFTAVTFIAVSILSLLLFCCRNHTKGEGIV